MSDAESEACETQVWIEFARRCDYLDKSTCEDMDNVYDQIIGQLVKMIQDADKWLILGVGDAEKKQCIYWQQQQTQRHHFPLALLHKMEANNGN